MNSSAERVLNWAIRPLVFGLLWILILLQVERAVLPYALLLCALAFLIYFFVPVATKPNILYIAVLLTLLPLVALQIKSETIGLLIAFLLVDTCFRLDSKEFKMFIFAGLAIGTLLFALTGGIQLTTLLLLIGAGLLAFSANRSRSERVEYRQLYDGLLDEYRKLKRNHSENERIARIEERARIAHDIHDSVGHQLTALLMQLEIMSIEHQSTQYEGLKVMAKQSLEETRNAVKTLKYESASGIESVLQLIRKLESDQFSVKFTTKQGVLRTRLSNEQSVVLYRSIQEALTNAMKHGDTREVSVTIGRTALGELEWIVTNGLSRHAHFEEGFGLTAMRERVNSIGGELRVFQTEKAFTVEGKMPIGGVKVGS